MSANADSLPTDWWSVEHVLRFLSDEGTPIAANTWTSYVSRHQAPEPDRMFGRSPAWRPVTIRSWQKDRPRKNSLESSP